MRRRRRISFCDGRRRKGVGNRRTRWVGGGGRAGLSGRRVRDWNRRWVGTRWGRLVEGGLIRWVRVRIRVGENRGWSRNTVAGVAGAVMGLLKAVM